MTATHNTPTHTHRGHTIVKYDSGARRMGRDIYYTVMIDGQTLFKAYTLTEAKTRIDYELDATADDLARRDEITRALGF